MYVGLLKNSFCLQHYFNFTFEIGENLWPGFISENTERKYSFKVYQLGKFQIGLPLYVSVVLEPGTN